MDYYMDKASKKDKTIGMKVVGLKEKKMDKEMKFLIKINFKVQFIYIKG